jgi:hypothetical protein
MLPLASDSGASARPIEPELLLRDAPYGMEG